jgi:hypothetical protein
MGHLIPFETNQSFQYKKKETHSKPKIEAPSIARHKRRHSPIELPFTASSKHTSIQVYPSATN